MVDKVKLDMHVLKKQKYPKRENMKIKYANKFIQNMGLGYPTTYFYQSVFIIMTVMTQILSFLLTGIVH